MIIRSPGWETKHDWDDTAHARFWAKVDRFGPIPEFAPHLGKCWLWTAKPDGNGYGRLHVGAGRKPKAALAHVAAYELLVGRMPDGLNLDHLCRVRICVNPDHLEPVTIGENARRSPITIQTLNAQKTHCPQGHPYDEENTRVRRVNDSGLLGRTCKACQHDRYMARYYK